MTTPLLDPPPAAPSMAPKARPAGTATAAGVTPGFEGLLNGPPPPPPAAATAPGAADDDGGEALTGHERLHRARYRIERAVVQLVLARPDLAPEAGFALPFHQFADSLLRSIYLEVVERAHRRGLVPRKYRDDDGVDHPPTESPDPLDGLILLSPEARAFAGRLLDEGRAVACDRDALAALLLRHAQARDPRRVAKAAAGRDVIDRSDALVAGCERLRAAE